LAQIPVPINQEGKTKIIDRSEFGIKTDLPDVTFLRKLSIEGRLRYFQGLGETPITITPAQGETFFFRSAIYSANDANVTTFTMTNDGQVREVVVLPIRSSGSTNIHSSIGMDSLVGNGSKTFTITTSEATANVSVFGWVENTSRIRGVTI